MSTFLTQEYEFLHSVFPQDYLHNVTMSVSGSSYGRSENDEI